MPETIKHLVGKYRAVTARLVMACEDAELRYYLFLKFHAIEKHSCYPSRAAAASALGWNRDKVTATVAKMIEAGRLEVERAAGQNNVYDITWYDRENEAGFVTVEDEGPGGKSAYHRAENPPTTGRKIRLPPGGKSAPNNKEVNNKEPTSVVAPPEASHAQAGDKSAKTTPADEARQFFSDDGMQAKVIDFLASKGADRAASAEEVAKFVSYWTEPTKTGRRVRWETEKTFEVRRRLVTWLNRVKDRRGGYSPKGVQSL
jgi:hypothetical protein